MEGCRLPKCLLVCKLAMGSRSIGRGEGRGGQKKRWNDMVMEDLRKCDLLEDWKEIARTGGAWRCFVMESM